MEEVKTTTSVEAHNSKPHEDTNMPTTKKTTATVTSPTKASHIPWMARDSAKLNERMDNTNFWVWKKPEYWSTAQWTTFLGNADLPTKYEICMAIQLQMT